MTTPAALPISRRHFLQTTAVVTAAALVPAPPGIRAANTPAGIIDTNVSLGQWPFRQVPLHPTSAVVEKLRGLAIAEAWAGSFEALLHKDISGVNARLAEDCQGRGGGLLMPIGAVNPMLPGWEEDLRRCADVHRMPGVRLHPNYHGYTLEDPLFERVLRLAVERGLFVQLSVIMEEERTIHPLVNVPPTDTAPLATVLENVPGVRLQLLNAFRTLRGVAVTSLAAHGVRFEIAMLEGVAGIEKLLGQIPPGSLCFGSHAPFFYPESAQLKLQESVLTAGQMKALCSDNARQLSVRP